MAKLESAFAIDTSRIAFDPLFAKEWGYALKDFDKIDYDDDAIALAGPDELSIGGPKRAATFDGDFLYVHAGDGKPPVDITGTVTGIKRSFERNGDWNAGASVEKFSISGLSLAAEVYTALQRGKDFLGLSKMIFAGADDLRGSDGDDRLHGYSGNDRIEGGLGNDRLYGGSGADRMLGGLGNDSYAVDHVLDKVTEEAKEGRDQITSSVDYTLGDNVEVLRLTGAAALEATGNDEANWLTGNGLGNTLDGREGNDVLTGGAGNDRFVFSTSIEGGRNVDRILDMNERGDDRILLDRDVFGAVEGHKGRLLADEFTTNTTGHAQDHEDRIIYETDTGRLFYDENGSRKGGATLFAVLDKGLTLSVWDFHIG